MSVAEDLREDLKYVLASDGHRLLYMLFKAIREIERLEAREAVEAAEEEGEL